MARLSNALFIVLNFLSFVLGFTAVSCSAYIQLHGGSSVCQKALEMPLLVIGLFLMIVSTIGLVGSCCRANLLLWLYLFVMFFLIVGLLLFTVFVLVVTNNMIGKRASPDRLHDYSTWLQNRFADGKNWEEIKGCLIDTQVCKNLGHVEIKHWSLLQVHFYSLIIENYTFSLYVNYLSKTWSNCCWMFSRAAASHRCTAD